MACSDRAHGSGAEVAQVARREEEQLAAADVLAIMERLGGLVPPEKRLATFARTPPDFGGAF